MDELSAILRQNCISGIFIRNEISDMFVLCLILLNMYYSETVARLQQQIMFLISFVLTLACRLISVKPKLSSYAMVVHFERMNLSNSVFISQLSSKGKDGMCTDLDNYLYHCFNLTKH